MAVDRYQPEGEDKVVCEVTDRLSLPDELVLVEDTRS